jgi:NAD(P)-dependent dehydrogenase (short-subunit alcohol dehydrogenase family)
MTDPRHLLLVGTGPGLGAAIARRFAREGYRLSARSSSPTPTGRSATSGPAPGAREYRFAGAAAVSSS